MSDTATQDATETVAVQLQLTPTVRSKLGAMAQLQRVTLSEWVSAAVTEAAARMGLPDLDGEVK